MPDSIHRRRFLQGASAAAALASAPQVARSQGGKVYRLGFIGTGRRGLGNMRSALERDDVEVVAVSEIYKPNLDKALALAPDAKVYPDFRDLIADSTIDAVCISTPDHWHAYQTVEACKAGKDVYVEKPIATTVWEGQMMVQAARKYDRVVQVGTQQRSGEHFQRVRDLVREGEIGEIAFVRTWNYSNQYPQGIGDPPDSEPPADLDWDMWLGPAPERPYNKNRFGVHPNRYSDFRWFWDYAGGMMTDWGIHLLDIVLWAMEEPGPTAVTAIGEKYVLQDNRDTPDTIVASYEFPKFACVYENRITNAESMFNESYGILFHGTKGTLFVDRSRWEIIPETESAEGGGQVQRMPAYSGTARGDSTDEHWADFVEAMNDRSKPVSDILEGHRSTTIALLGNVALRSKERFAWNPVEETTPNPEAAQYLRREYRAPWKLEL